MEIHLRKIVCFVCILLLNVPGSFSQPGVCGQAPLNTRIINGTDAPVGAWPWQARIEYRGGVCGGSLINKSWVLSAAHCFINETHTKINESEITVYLNNQTLLRNVIKCVTHKAYDDKTKDNDIALVKLSTSVNFTDHSQPACLAGEKDILPTGIKVWVTGWGRTDPNSDLSPKELQEMQVEIFSISECEKAYGPLSITDKMICAGLPKEGKDSCKGDSGGPMVFKLNESWTQFGIVSSGYNCALSDYPGVYTRVSSFQKWINTEINGQLGVVSFSFSYHVFPIFFCLLFHFSIIPFLYSISVF